MMISQAKRWELSSQVYVKRQFSRVRVLWDFKNFGLAVVAWLDEGAICRMIWRGILLTFWVTYGLHELPFITAREVLMIYSIIRTKNISAIFKFLVIEPEHVLSSWWWLSFLSMMKILLSSSFWYSFGSSYALGGESKKLNLKSGNHVKNGWEQSL